jgi:hypothetical protein
VYKFIVSKTINTFLALFYANGRTDISNKVVMSYVIINNKLLVSFAYFPER